MTSAYRGTYDHVPVDVYEGAPRRQFASGRVLKCFRKSLTDAFFRRFTLLFFFELSDVLACTFAQPPGSYTSRITPRDTMDSREAKDHERLATWILSETNDSCRSAAADATMLAS